MQTKDITQGDTSNRELSITRLLNAPRELVFRVWTEPEHVAKWWGPNGFSNTIHEMNVKQGGLWRLTMHGPDGRDYPNEIIYLEVVKPEKLVYRHTGAEGTEPVMHHVTVTFEAQGDKTIVHMKMIFSSAEELARLNEEYHADSGLVQTFGRMETYISTITTNM